MTERKFPNTFIVGAPKCGTTSLARWLGEHPDIFMSNPKEPHHFCRPSLQLGGVHTLEQYRALFATVRNEKIIAEASTATIYDSVALPLVRDHAPNARIVLMVRNPVQLALSWFGENVRQLREDILDFDTAWKAMPERQAGFRVPRRCSDPVMLDYRGVASVGSHLERIYEFFPEDQVFVGFLDDFIANPRTAWLKLLAFLGVADDGRTDFLSENVGYVPRYLGAYLAVRKSAQTMKRVLCVKGGTGVAEKMAWALGRPGGRFDMTPEVFVELQSIFDQEIKILERLTKRDLSHWRRADPNGLS